MVTRLLNLWDRFSSSFWFLPTVLIGLAVALALGMTVLDRYVERTNVAPTGWLQVSPQAARLLLSSLATAMMTLAAVVFSITVVTLSIASSQFGSRLLRAFMADRVTELAIGSFLASSVYCLLVLYTVREGDSGRFVPHLAVVTGVGAAVLNLGVLIFFIHHVGVSIQAPKIVETLATDLRASIDRLFPESLDEAPDTSAQERPPEALASSEDVRIVTCRREGYVQAIDSEGLVALANRLEVVIELVVRPGEFVTFDSPLAAVRPPEKVTDDARRQVAAAMIVGSRRTPRQDVRCAVDELVEVAVRALSPGINDPFSAVNCIDRLSAALARLAQRKIPSGRREDRDGKLRVVARPVAFPEVLHAAFDSIRQYARRSPTVARRMLEGLALVAKRVRRPEDRMALLDMAERIVNGLEQGDTQECDRRMTQELYGRVRAVLSDSAKLPT